MRSLFLASAVFLCGTVAAVAATLHVPAEYTTINEAMDAAVPGDSVLIAPGTYTESDTRVIDIGGAGSATATSAIFLKDGVTVIGEGGPTVTTVQLPGIPTLGVGWVVVGGLLSSGSTSLEGLTITGARPGGAGLCLGSSARVTVRDCVFRDIDTGGTTYGGAVCSAYTTLELIDCEFHDCHAGFGGAVTHTANDFLMDGCLVDGCTGTTAAVHIEGGLLGGPWSFTVRNSEFRNNPEGGFRQDGPAYSAKLIEDCLFADNAAWAGGGIFVSSPTATITVRRNVFLRDSATQGAGGGVFVDVPQALFLENTFHGCSQVSTYHGGASLYVTNLNQTITNNLFSGASGSEAVDIHNLATLSSMTCNVYWDNSAGDIRGAPLDPTDRIVDPLFCGPAADDLRLARNSPCLPAGSGSCGQIGALGEGCDPISVTSLSWGAIKSAYR